MAFNLPKAWSPGYALPQYVRDEGLERHAFVTLELPDGYYDEPRVGGGGYAVPQYVLNEGYGQGAVITAWAPRGTYYGPKLPYWLNQTGNVIRKAAPVKGGGVEFTLQTLGATDDVIPAAYQKYGQKAASSVLRRVMSLPPGHRKPALKKLLDAVDPSLYGRARDIAARAQRAGASPARALQHGLGRAMSAGILAEVVQSGRTGRPPKKRSQLGLAGCFGCGFAGALGDATTSKAVGINNPIVAQLMANIPPRLQIGPWSLPGGVGQNSTFPLATMTAEQSKALTEGLMKSSAAYFVTLTPQQLMVPTYRVDVANYGLGKGQAARPVIEGKIPLFKFTHPQDGKRYGVFLSHLGPKTAPSVTLQYRYDPSLVEAIWSGIKELVAAIVDVVKDVVSELSDLACTLITSPQGKMGAQVGAVAAGAPPQAGAAGADMAAKACAGPPPPPPPTVASSSSYVLPVAIAGGAVVLGLLLTRKKKA